MESSHLFIIALNISHVTNILTCKAGTVGPVSLADNCNIYFCRSFTLSGKMKPDDVAATLSSLPDNILGNVCISLPSEDALSARKRKLEFLKVEDKLIEVI